METRETGANNIHLRGTDTVTSNPESRGTDGSTGSKSGKGITVNLTGGAARCAFQAGFLTFLMERGADILNINAISGGVINAYFLQSGKWAELENFWLREVPEHTNRLKWYAGIPFNVLARKNGLLSPDFSKVLINRHVNEIVNDFSFEVVSMFTGKQHTLTGKDFTNLQEYRLALYAAVSIPVAFSPVDILTKDEPIIDACDGGIYYPLPPNYADIQISTHYPERNVERVNGPFSALLRTWNWRQWAILNDLFAEPNLYGPSEPLPKSWDWSKDSLTFSFYHGREVAAKNIDKILT